MKNRKHRAFTLVELLIVIAVIGILAGSLAAVLRTGDKGPALQAAQATLSGFVSAARAQAALGNTTATLVIWADRDDPETYLRRAAIAVRVDTNEPPDGVTDSYAIQGGVQDLPRGIFFVPEEGGNTLPAKFEPLADWTTPDKTYTESQITGHGTTSATATGKRFRRFEESSSPQWQVDPDAPATYYECVVFDAYGKLSNQNVNYLAVAPGDIQNGPNSADRGVIFRSVDGLRGLKLSTYGVPIQLNEKSAFE